MFHPDFLLFLQGEIEKFLGAVQHLILEIERDVMALQLEEAIHPACVTHLGYNSIALLSGRRRVKEGTNIDRRDLVVYRHFGQIMMPVCRNVSLIDSQILPVRKVSPFEEDFSHELEEYKMKATVDFRLAYLSPVIASDGATAVASNNALPLSRHLADTRARRPTIAQPSASKRPIV